ncbi:MAG: hypothetical protein QM740_02010 [Acidovorax sp.]
MFVLQKLMKRHHPKPAHGNDGLATLQGTIYATDLGKIQLCNETMSQFIAKR